MESSTENVYYHRKDGMFVQPPALESSCNFVGRVAPHTGGHVTAARTGWMDSCSNCSGRAGGPGRAFSIDISISFDSSSLTMCGVTNDDAVVRLLIDALHWRVDYDRALAVSRHCSSGWSGLVRTGYQSSPEQSARFRSEITAFPACTLQRRLVKL